MWYIFDSKTSNEMEIEMKIKFELEEKMPYIKGLSEGSQKISWCSFFLQAQF